MQEYLERFDHNPDSVGDPVEEKYRPGRVRRRLVPQVLLIVSVRLICFNCHHECRGVYCDASR